ncbi:S1C family serine protease [Tessaracoccus oleiagri]|uniref:Putative serine protease PepD n=1 Tax=Tessaracoccus oleiagri TaxID=686624 RepID=A0A1G9N2D0_9ACTN|nr:trypsin-like peptidase domain-containing protein [Tessaracoccus oleiagri]SDL80658.1 putative serine protease PepD [Tessaracoccus oleiagri]
MSDTPNPWNDDHRRADTGPQGQPSANAPRYQERPQFQQGPQYPQGQQAGASYPRPEFQTRPTSQPWQGQPSMGGGYRPPMQQSYGPQPQPSRSPQKKGSGKLAAGFVGVALLAAGVGAGSGIVADRYWNTSEPAVTSTQEEQGTGTTTVVQADPNAPDWATVADVASKSVVAIQVATAQGGGQGSGVVIDTDGNIITNNHVVNGARQILVTLGDESFQAELVGTDPATDLAVIRLTDPPEDLTPIAIGDSNALVVGDPVMAIGNPLGLSGTVTTGIVSALDRPVTTQAVGASNRDTVVTAAIQTNAAINPGNSGGALVNSSGELVGITTSIASLPGSSSGGQAGNIGIGFAIGSDQAQHVAEQLLEDGTAQHPQVGVTARDVQEVGTMGAEVVTVVPGSPAAEGGLQPGDVITAINDRTVSSTSQLVGLVRAQKVGEPITVTYVRGGEESTVEVTPVAASE